MCVRRRPERTDDELAAELRAYFIRVGMTDDQAHEAARRWIEHVNANQEPE
jgi:hypothetical protein